MEPKEIKELLEKLGDLSDEELRSAEQKLQDQIDELGKGDLSDDDLGLMDEVASAIMSVRETVSAREEDRSARQEKASEIRSKVTPQEETSEEGEKKAEGKTEDTEKSESESPKAEGAKTESSESEGSEGTEGGEGSEGSEGSEGAPAREPAGVAASGGDDPSLSELNERRPASMTPRVNEQNPALTVVAAGDVPGFSAGQQIDEWDAIGEAFVSKVDTLRGARLSNGQRFPVARFNAAYPEERRLTADDAEENWHKIDEVISPRALVASGGLCAPVEVHYGLANVSRSSRPVRDALARFQAQRGGIRFITPPTLDETTGAIDFITEADDAAGGASATKDILTITCGVETTVNIAAVSLRLQIGQFSRMTFPEQFRTWYDLALAQHARQAEGRLLDGISDNSTAVTTGQTLGASREFLETYGRLAAQYRNRHRMDPNATLQVLLPRWVADAIQADVTLQLPGDGLEAFAISISQIEAWFRARNLAVTWYEDERVPDGDQVYAAQTAAAGLGWIGTAEGYLFHPGAFLFVDGGSLDLGVEIRDTTTIATNDIQAFMETFENVAFTGIESLRVRSEICVSGGSSGTVDVTCPGTGS